LTPIGTGISGNYFAATFNGNGFAVKGVYINTASNYQGLFGYVSDGTISNLGTEQSYINGGQSVGSDAHGTQGIRYGR